MLRFAVFERTTTRHRARAHLHNLHDHLHNVNSNASMFEACIEDPPNLRGRCTRVYRVGNACSALFQVLIVVPPLSQPPTLRKTYPTLILQGVAPNTMLRPL